jgi:hypothetical protein
VNGVGETTAPMILRAHRRSCKRANPTAMTTSVRSGDIATSQADRPQSSAGSEHSAGSPLEAHSSTRTR